MNNHQIMISKQGSYPVKLKMETDPCTDYLLLTLTLGSLNLRHAIDTQSSEFKENPGLVLSSMLERAYDDLTENVDKRLYGEGVY